MEIILRYLTPGVLWVVFLLVVAFVTLIGITLSYHWKEYSTDVHRTKRFFNVYMAVTGIFLGVMAISIVLYSYGS